MGLLDVIYRDEDLVVVNKPEALLVHRTRQSGDHVAALQLVREQLGQKVYPATGRRHQIRKHMKHLGHPLIGDTTYGRGAHNRYFRDTFGIYRLLLHARCIELPHPATEQPLRIEVSETSDASWRSLYEQWAWLPKSSGYPDVVL